MLMELFIDHVEGKTATAVHFAVNVTMILPKNVVEGK
jgi:hypothetical protein